MPTKELLPYLITVGILIYGFAGGAAFNLWMKRIGRNRPVSLHTDPNRWLRYKRPRVAFMGIYGLVGIVALGFLIASTTPVLRGPDAHYVELAWALGLIFIVVFFTVAYMVMGVSSRRATRHQPTADTRDHS